MQPETQALRALLGLSALQVRRDRQERVARWERLARQETSVQQELRDQLAHLAPQELLELQDQLAALGESAPPALVEQAALSAQPALRA